MGCVYVHSDIHIWRLADPKSVRWAVQGKLLIQFKSLWNSFLLGGDWFFVLFRPLADQMRPIHNMKDSQSHSESIDLSVKSHRNIKDNICQVSKFCCPAKLTRKWPSHQVNITLVPDQPSLPQHSLLSQPYILFLLLNLDYLSFFYWIKNIQFLIESLLYSELEI